MIYTTHNTSPRQLVDATHRSTISWIRPVYLVDSLEELGQILAKVGTIAYRLGEQLSCVHSTLHVSNLKKCLSDESLVIPLDEIQINDKLYFIEEPVEIMDREVRHLKQSRIPIVKVRWNSKRGPEFTWEREDQMQTRSILTSKQKFKGNSKGGQSTVGLSKK
ncbi:hypothetical protein Tco_0510628 [Tanacetum coccineum]